MRLPVTGGFRCSARGVGHRLVRDYPAPRAVSRPTLSTRAPRGRCGVGWVPDRTPADRRDGDSLHDSLRRDRTPRLVPPKVGLSRKQVGNPPKRGLALAEGGTEASNRDPPAQARSEEHTSELQSRLHLVCRLLLEKKKTQRCTSAWQ